MWCSKKIISLSWKNGDVLALTKDSARRAGHFNAQDIYVDGNGIGDIGAAVLRDRRDPEDGVVLAVATVDFKSKMILAGPDILSRGFIYMRESGDLLSVKANAFYSMLFVSLLRIRMLASNPLTELSSMLYAHSYMKRQNVNQSLFQ